MTVAFPTEYVELILQTYLHLIVILVLHILDRNNMHLNFLAVYTILVEAAGKKLNKCMQRERRSTRFQISLLIQIYIIYMIDLKRTKFAHTEWLLSLT